MQIFTENDLHNLATELKPWNFKQIKELAEAVDPGALSINQVYTTVRVAHRALIVLSNKIRNEKNNNFPYEVYINPNGLKIWSNVKIPVESVIEILSNSLRHEKEFKWHVFSKEKPTKGGPYYVTLIDRYGNRVFHTLNYNATNKRWDMEGVIAFMEHQNESNKARSVYGPSAGR